MSRSTSVSRPGHPRSGDRFPFHPVTERTGGALASSCPSGLLSGNHRVSPELTFVLSRHWQRLRLTLNLDDFTDIQAAAAVVSRVVTALATSGVAVLDLAAHQNEIATRLAGIISEDLNLIGLQMPRFIIENVSLPPEVEATMDKRTSMGVLDDLDRFTKFQAATAITQAAQNPGGIAGVGVGIGVGATLGAQLAQALQPGAALPSVPAAASTPAEASTTAPAGPPPLPTGTQWYLGQDGRQIGPLTSSDIRARVAAGTGTPETLVWRAGLEAWARLGDMPELQAVQSSTPPPLPA